MSGNPSDNDARSVRIARLWTTAVPSIRAFLFAAVRDSSAADDLIQDTAVAVMKKFDNFEPDTDFLAWAITIARYEVLAFQRRQGHEGHILSDSVLENLAVGIIETSGESDRRQSALRRCIDQLPERQRRIIANRYEHDQSIATIAAQEEVTANSLAVMLHRIRVALRECIDRRIAIEVS